MQNFQAFVLLKEHFQFAILSRSTKGKKNLRICDITEVNMLKPFTIHFEKR